MKIGLIDVDSKMPNLALMKISQYHKNKGDKVYWYEPLFERPDKIYASKVFKFTSDYGYYPKGIETIKGGSGYDLTTKLPKEIEEQNLDYSLYPNCNYSLQMFSRGCIRNCSFCLVRQKEGGITPIEHLNLNPKGEWIEILDNNFFANPEWEDAIEKLLGWKQPVKFHGIDVRILNEKQAYFLNKLKHKKYINMAWDNPEDNLLPKFENITQWIKPYKIICYVLIGYNSTRQQDLYRVQKLHELGINPFVMPYKDIMGYNIEDIFKRCGFTGEREYKKYLKDFSRWVNRKWLFKSVKWENYKKKKTNNKEGLLIE